MDSYIGPETIQMIVDECYANRLAYKQNICKQHGVPYPLFLKLKKKYGITCPSKSSRSSLNSSNSSISETDEDLYNTI